jgi:hypothetical protein
VGILNSLELFLAIAQTMESELTHSRDFYLLSVDICKTLMLVREHRPSEGKQYLEEKYSVYCKLVENSILVDRVLTDKMLPSNELIQYQIQTLLNKPAFPSGSSRDRWLRAFKGVRAAQRQQVEEKVVTEKTPSILVVDQAPVLSAL